MASPVIQVKRGLYSNLPALKSGEPGFTTDKYDLFVGLDETLGNNQFFGSGRYWEREDGTNAAQLKLVDKDGSNGINLQVPDTTAGIGTWILPNSNTGSQYGLLAIASTSGDERTLEWTSITTNSFDATTLVIESEGISSNDSDTQIPTTAAVKDYVDTTIGNIDLDFAGDTGTGAVDLDSQSFTIAGTSNEIETSASGQTITIGLPDDVTIGQDLTVSRDVQIVRNLNVDGNITVGGTTATLFTQTLKVADADLILGIRTDGSGNDISTDNTANHGGIAIASTEGNSLITLTNPGAGETLPSTYKKIMWFKEGSFSGLGTDAWLINYAVGIGSTQFPTGTRLAAGNVQFTENDLAVVRNINSTGVSTLPTLDTTNATIDNLTFTSGTAITSVDTDLSSVSASDDTLASAKAIKSYVDGEVSTVNTTIGNIDLDFAGDSGTGAVDLDSQTFTIAGTANEIETSGSGQTLTIGLPNEVAITTSLTAPKIYVGSGNEAYLDRANGSNGDLRIFSTNNIIFNLDTTDAVIFDYTQGYVGIGSTTPTEKLDVIGTAKVDGLKFGSGTAVTSVDTDLSSVSASDDTLASAKAIKSYVDAQATAQDLDFAGDTGSGSIDLDSETFTIVGTENEIQTVGSGNTLTIGLTETGVTADTYGSSTQVSQFTVDENGRITSALNVNIDFGNANVATADSLTNSRDIEATGDISWAVNFKGHENVSADATLTSIITPGTVGSSTQVGVVTFDAKGRITSASNVNIDFGNANVATADSLTDSRNIAATGDIAWNVDFKGHENVSGIATLADTGVVAGTYGSSTQVGIVTVDSKGRITSASNVNIDFGNANVATADYADNAGIATNLKGGIASQIPYQTAANTTDFIPNGTSGQLLQSNGTSAPSWISVGDISAGTAQTANNLSGGAAGSIPYQDAPGSTVFLTEPNANGYILTYNNSSNAPQWQQLSSIYRTYTLDAVDSGDNVILRLSDGSTNDDVTITAGSNITIDSVASSGFTISAVAGAGLAPDSTISDLISISGGTISADDAGADRIFFWDDSQSKATHLSVGSGLQISGTTLSATSAGSVTDVTVSQVSYGGTNPITVTSPSAGTEQINIPDSSNAYGTRFIETYTPTTEGNNGDVWYQVSS